MDLVGEVMAELATHRPGCGCGCSWVHKADPVLVFRSAGYWQRGADRARRLSRLISDANKDLTPEQAMGLAHKRMDRLGSGARDLFDIEAPE